MNENLKNLLEKVSADEVLRAKFEPLTKMEDKDDAVEAILALAAEAGMPLTAEDLEPEEGLDLDELDAVAGGVDLVANKACACVLGGAGEEGTKDGSCFCAFAGSGDTKTSPGRCICPFVGGGTSKD